MSRILWAASLRGHVRHLARWTWHEDREHGHYAPICSSRVERLQKLVVANLPICTNCVRVVEAARQELAL